MAILRWNLDGMTDLPAGVLLVTAGGSSHAHMEVADQALLPLDASWDSLHAAFVPDSAGVHTISHNSTGRRKADIWCAHRHLLCIGLDLHMRMQCLQRSL